MAQSLKTFFAPAGRAPRKEVRRLASRSIRNPVVQTVLDAVGGYVMILNTHRQVLAANPELLEALQIEEMDSVLGMRPGEVFDCEHSIQGPDGCGTSLHCRPCGAAISILAALTQDTPVTDECCITMKRGRERKTVEMRVKATPLQLGNDRVIALVLHDISAEKRRAVLEDVFLHDMRNTLTGLMGWAEFLDKENSGEAARMVVLVAALLRDELEAQHLLVSAEKGVLKVRKRDVAVPEILGAVESVCGSFPGVSKERFEVDSAEDGATIVTDPTLLVRVLVNMMKNGLEATSQDECVRLWFDDSDGRPTFLVHNPGFIPEEVALRIFRRSFSTKQKEGRGLGTYSMKLFGEQYLGGSVRFVSSEADGTTFFIELPEVGEP
jgi:signal transduction histidine kinase